MSGQLNGQQFPRYEVGDPAEHEPERRAKWAANNYHMTNYGRKDEVSPAHFGVPVETPGRLTHGLTYHMAPGASKPDYEDVPMSQVSVAQSYVYKPHVENLATIPQHVLQDPSDSIDAVKIGDRYIVEHGTHRTAAAALRGDKTLGVKVHGEYR